MPALLKADHIGSFLRPPELLEARRSATPELLRQIDDQHILRILAKQKELGFQAATDGSSVGEISWAILPTPSKASTWRTR
jgi:methionine synthase II (cobalamin-independent)